MKYDVFISYSRRDYTDENRQVIPGNIISQIKELFDANGITYWFDEEGVFCGDAFAPVIARNIKASSIFLFISSEHSNTSEWTSNEIATAHAYKKKIIPFRYDDSVYNDSVIMYISRLDYIEYKSNPTKATQRLLSSVQSYLNAERDKEERARAEEEQRRQAEISRQERAAKLQALREKIELLENRKFEIEKEILTQEKTLIDLRNEKRIVEANIVDLQEEEATLLGHNRPHAQPKAQPIEKPATPRISTPNTEKQGWLAREWADLKSAMSQKHWIVNTSNILCCLGEIGCFSGTLCWCLFDKWHRQMPSLLIASFFAFVGGYRIFKNYKIGYAWLFVACMFFGFAGVKKGGFFPFFITGLFAITVQTLILLIRKNGVSALKLLKKRTITFKNNVSQIIVTTFAAGLLSIFFIYWGIQSNRLRELKKEFYDVTSSEECKALDDRFWKIHRRHPFWDYYDSGWEYKVDAKLNELKELEELRKQQELRKRKQLSEQEKW